MNKEEILNLLREIIVDALYANNFDDSTLIEVRDSIDDQITKNNIKNVSQSNP